MVKLLLQYSYLCEVALCIVTLGVLVRRSLVSTFKVLTILLLTRIVGRSLSVGLLFHRKALGLSIDQDYNFILKQGWITGIIDGFLVFFLIYTTFWEAMRPLQGLHNIGKIIFRWVFGVSIAFAAAVVLGPHERNVAAVSGQTLPSRFNDGISVLTLCLLLFVCFAIRPLGLTFRSRIFGISLGLGVMTSIDLVQSGWIASVSGQSVYSPVYLVDSIGILVGLSIWLVYFILPEPERLMILLPTTSPFFFWNRVSEVLGDDPGHVAVGGIKPSMLAAAELKVLSATNKRGGMLPDGTPVSPEERVSLPSATALPSAASR